MSDQILIAYYSWAGSTARLARQIHDKTGGELFEIIPQVPYPADYDACTLQARKEIQAGYKPELKTGFAGIEKFGVILLGSPNWWSSLAPPAARFLSEFDLSGKIIAPFCTHGGGGQGHIVKDIEKLCPRSKVVSCLTVNSAEGGAKGGRSGLTDADLQTWLKQAGIA